ncbi:ABC transporter substrate-binding protein [Rhodovastum atsumiense]|uniref:ABC transporter substrate-binding protein n=1 Tax=Rhodovastum atsumiense TaxID=504468 RepID=A0A5M6IRX6_9PROT|nr:ABC transporter substrate-binding protein [Rhodovastum atsumiense]KAA5610941.1 ABC transporter substrate-binding protein [Rhodovastum atsumiense]CAH2601486.1 ABC transporter substrate-binding protein [Rhodovastum atsumiense]
MKLSRAGFVSGLLATLLPGGGAGAAEADTVTVAHAHGRTTLRRLPAPVLVFDLGALDTLDALGVPVAGVPDWRMPPALARYQARSYARIGSLFEPDFEAVAAARPGLVITGPRMHDKYAALSTIAPTIELSLDPGDFTGSMERNAIALGRIFGKEEEVAARLERLRATTAAVRARGEAAGTALIVLTSGGRISAYGPGSRFGMLHDMFGLQPADPALPPATHGQPVSPEYIARTDPDWLFVVDRDTAVGRPGRPAAVLLDTPLVAATKAGKAGRIVFLDPVRFYLTSGGLASEQAIVDDMAHVLGGA